MLRWLTVSEFCSYYKLSSETVERLITKKLLVSRDYGTPERHHYRILDDTENLLALYQDTQDRLWNVPMLRPIEVAELVGVSRATINLYIKRGILRVKRRGGLRLVTLREVDRLATWRESFLYSKKAARVRRNTVLVCAARILLNRSPILRKPLPTHELPDGLSGSLPLSGEDHVSQSYEPHPDQRSSDTLE